MSLIFIGQYPSLQMSPLYKGQVWLKTAFTQYVQAEYELCAVLLKSLNVQRICTGEYMWNIV